MRILHAPTNIAGQPYVLSRALRRLGHVSDVLVTRRHPFGYSQDIVFDFDRLWTPWRQVRKAFALLHLRKSYDVFHFHYGESLLARHRDLPMLKRAGKRIVFHFRGCDIRMRGLELARRATCACKDCPALGAPLVAGSCESRGAWVISTRTGSCGVMLQGRSR